MRRGRGVRGRGPRCAIVPGDAEGPGAVWHQGPGGTSLPSPPALDACRPSVFARPTAWRLGLRGSLLRDRRPSCCRCPAVPGLWTYTRAIPTAFGSFVHPAAIDFRAKRGNAYFRGLRQFASSGTPVTLGTREIVTTPPPNVYCSRDRFSPSVGEAARLGRAPAGCGEARDAACASGRTRWAAWAQATVVAWRTSPSSPDPRIGPSRLPASPTPEPGAPSGASIEAAGKRAKCGVASIAGRTSAPARPTGRGSHARCAPRCPVRR